jgi:tetratricopeptide (TPR) repeat protein
MASLWNQFRAFLLAGAKQPELARAVLGADRPPRWLVSRIARAFTNRAVICHQQALRKHGPEANWLFMRASENYQAALAVEPDSFVALNDWGVALLDEAKRRDGEVADRLLAQASQNFRSALRIQPRHAMALSNLGLVLSRQARLATGEEADTLFAQAGEQYAASLKVRPKQPRVLCNWSGALIAQAQQKSGAEADQLFAQACEKCAAVLAFQSHHDGAIQNWGVALLNQAKQKSGEEADRLFAAARQKFLEAELIRPGSASYNLACLCALRKEPECRTWLETCRQHGELVRHPKLASDPDFESVRGSEWFQELVAEPAAQPSPAP